MSIGQFDGLGHCIGIFTTMIQRFEAQASSIHMRVLRTLFRRHFFVSVRECYGGASFFNFHRPQSLSSRDESNTRLT